MRNVMKWFKKSNRNKHLLGGILIGAGSDTLYCATYAGVGIASALELKDKLWGGKPDMVDWVLTIVGVAMGFGIRTLVKLL